MAHSERILVQYEDLDAMGMVHNGRYVFLLERVMHAFWTGHGYAYVNGRYTHPDAATVVAEFSISYRAPIVGAGEVDVHLWVERFGESSLVYGFRLASPQGGATHAEGRRVQIRIDPGTGRATPWAADTRKIFESLQLDDAPDDAQQGGSDDGFEGISRS